MEREAMGTPTGWRMVLIAATTLSALFQAGCGSGGESGGGPETGRGSAAPDRVEAGTTVSPYETLGFAMGKSYAYGCLYTILEKQDLAKPKFALVIEAADGLGLKSPRIPASRDEAFDLMLDEYFPRQIEDRFGATPRASYDLAVLVVNTWFGTTIGAESRPGADKIRRYLVSAKVPQAVWDDALTRIARGGNEDDVNHLEKVLDEYYRRR